MSSPSMTMYAALFHCPKTAVLPTRPVAVNSKQLESNLPSLVGTTPLDASHRHSAYHPPLAHTHPGRLTKR